MIGAIRQWREMWQWLPSGIASLVTDSPRVPFSDFLTRSVEPIDKTRHGLESLNVIKKITFGGEVFIRSPLEKAGYKGPLFQAKAGDLVISKIRVAQGSFSIVPADFDPLAVSAEYPIYKVDSDIADTSFLALVLRTPEFRAVLASLRSGNTTKTRIRPQEFESLDIPLPDLSEQKKLVSAYEAAQSQARTLEQRAHETERAARRDFEAALGLTPPPDLPRRFAQIARFRDIERWSHEGVLDQSLPRDKSTHFPLMRLADVVADLENGWSPQCESRPAREGEWAVLKLGAVSFGTFDARQNKALPMRLKPRPELEIRAGEVLISRANITRLVGACAHVQETPPHLMLCDKIFRAVFFDDSPIHGDFLAEVLKTPGVRKQIESRVTGTSPTMKNISKPALLDLEFPLPPTDIQASLTAKLHRSREATSKLLAQAAAARQAAWRAFVAAVFG